MGGGAVMTPFGIVVSFYNPSDIHDGTDWAWLWKDKWSAGRTWNW